MWSNPRVRASVDCKEMDQGDVREVIVVGWDMPVEESQAAMEARRYC